MEHVVFYPGPDAAPAFRRFASLDEAVRFVEHLRNTEGVSEVSVHVLTPVPVAFRAYYKVEVPAVDGLDAGSVVVEQPVGLLPEQSLGVDSLADVPAPVEPVADVPTPELADADLVAVAPVEGDAGSNGKRTLGFFAH